MECRLSATYDDSIEESLTRPQISEKYLLRDSGIREFCQASGENELGIIAKATPKIASRSKYDGRNLSWVVDEGSLADAGYAHRCRERDL